MREDFLFAYASAGSPQEQRDVLLCCLESASGDGDYCFLCDCHPGYAGHGHEEGCPLRYSEVWRLHLEPPPDNICPNCEEEVEKSWPKGFTCKCCACSRCLERR